MLPVSPVYSGPARPDYPDNARRLPRTAEWAGKSPAIIMFARKSEAAIGRYKRVIGDALRSRTDGTEATEVAIAAAALNRMLGLERPNYIRIA
jgi:hypothetical protein